MGLVEDALTEASAKLDDAANSLAELDLSQEREEVVNFLNSVSNMLNEAANALSALHANISSAVTTADESVTTPGEALDEEAAETTPDDETGEEEPVA